jgi:hypothetical protein
VSGHKLYRIFAVVFYGNVIAESKVHFMVFEVSAFKSSQDWDFYPSCDLSYHNTNFSVTNLEILWKQIVYILVKFFNW